MYTIVCPHCTAALGTAEQTPQALEAAYAASLRTGATATEADYEVSRSIVRAQNAQRDIILAHLEAVHPVQYWHSFPIAQPGGSPAFPHDA